MLTISKTTCKTNCLIYGCKEVIWWYVETWFKLMSPTRTFIFYLQQMKSVAETANYICFFLRIMRKKFFLREWCAKREVFVRTFTIFISFKQNQFIFCKNLAHRKKLDVNSERKNQIYSTRSLWNKNEIFYYFVKHLCIWFFDINIP